MPHIGMVQIFWRNTWKVFTTKHWTRKLSELVCHYLGYPGVADNTTKGSDKKNHSYVLLNAKNCENADELIECLHEEKPGVSDMLANNSIELHCNEPGEKHMD